jgi:hypothetical protein
MFVLAHLSGALSTLIFAGGLTNKKEGTLILYHSERQISTLYPEITQNVSSDLRNLWIENLNLW